MNFVSFVLRHPPNSLTTQALLAANKPTAALVKIFLALDHEHSSYTKLVAVGKRAAAAAAKEALGAKVSITTCKCKYKVFGYIETQFLCLGFGL